MTALHRLLRQICGRDTGEAPLKSGTRAFSQSWMNLTLFLDLVVRGALQKTSAGGAAVAVIEGDVLICRARAGKIAPDLDMVQEIRSGFTGMCVREGRTLNCEDAHTDSSVNAAACHALGIRSILAVPILRGTGVLGVIELFSRKAGAFGAEEVRWLERVAELICDLFPETLSADVGTWSQQETAQSNVGQDELKLADLVQVLQQSSPTATWDEIRQRLVSRR